MEQGATPGERPRLRALPYSYSVRRIYKGALRAQTMCRREIASRAHAEVAESGAYEAFAIEGIAAVEHDALAHGAAERVPIQVQILGPLGHQDDGVHIHGNLEGGVADLDFQIRVFALEARGSHRIMSSDSNAAFD